MYAVSLVRHIRKSCFLKMRPVVLPSRDSQLRSIKTKTSFGAKPRVENDIVLFSLEKPKFFVAINLLSGCQCLFWTYLAYFLYFQFRNTTLNLNGKEFWKKTLELEQKYSTQLSAVGLVFGWTIFIATIFYTSRSVRKVILHKGGRNVTIVTYTLPGLHKAIQVPLSQVSAGEQRVKARKYFSLKVKNKYLYYLIDLKGNFSDPTLFDFTLGVRRNL